MERVKTGIIGFDEMIEGGIPKESTVLITGTPGVGKSIMLMHIIAHNILRNNMKCFYLSVEQPRQDIIEQAKQFGWDFEKMEQEGKLTIIALNSPELLEIQQVKDIKQLIQKNHYDLAVVDSLTSLSQMPVSSSLIIDTAGKGYHPLSWQELRRINAILLMDTMKQAGITSLFTSHNSGDEDDNSMSICEYRADCLISLKRELLGETLSRTLQVIKMRQTKINGIPYDFEFTREGLTLMPDELHNYAGQR